jgi:hypothetical protein
MTRPSPPPETGHEETFVERQRAAATGDFIRLLCDIAFLMRQYDPRDMDVVIDRAVAELISERPDRLREARTAIELVGRFKAALNRRRSLKRRRQASGRRLAGNQPSPARSR